MSEGRPTLGDVAVAAGVHKATASRALNAATLTRVQPETARRVQEAARRLGYQPNMHARSLRTNSSATIGVILPDIASPLYPPLVRGIEDALHPMGYTALVASTDIVPAREQSAYDSLAQRQVDGFIAGISFASRPLLAATAERGTPVVLLSAEGESSAMSSVDIDTAAGIAAVVDLLVGLGHTRIAHISGPPAIPDSPARERQFRAAVLAHRLAPAATPVVAAAAHTIVAGRDAMGRVLDQYPDVTAVAAYNDTIAVGAMRAIREAGLRCPDDISVAGFNDLPMMAELTPALTTVRIPAHEFGYAAARLLLGQLSGGTGPLHVVLASTLIPRESTAPPPRSG